AGDSPANVLVTGDLALLHDANALAAAARHRLPLLVVLVNNDGGGIFEMLPVRDQGAAYTEHYETPHGTDFAALTAAHGIPHSVPRDWEDFRRQVSGALAAQQAGNTGTSVIEIRTERHANRALHEKVWALAAIRPD
ncbi:MAG: thiamine pyrophosphate-dependent enzyme, partial [Deltaproteobacteria bacterium]|nr:thiamine pyrophosphate-dependent enzyme [Deltaproteobacteria bacterium]